MDKYQIKDRDIKTIEKILGKSHCESHPFLMLKL